MLKREQDIIHRLRFYVRRALTVYGQSANFAVFWGNLDARDIVMFNIVQVSESAKRLESVTERDGGLSVSLPVREMMGLRNRIVHDYEGVSPEVLEEVLDTDLPQLMKALEVIQLDLPVVSDDQLAGLDQAQEF